MFRFRRPSRPDVPPTPPPEAPMDLTARHRCERCNAQAFVEAVVIHTDQAAPEVRKTTALYFCGHHFRKHEEALRQVAVLITDSRATAEAMTE